MDDRAKFVERLRDVAVHGQYCPENANWIRIRHRFAYSTKPEATRMFGCLKFLTLKALVKYIEVAKDLKIDARL